MYRQLVFLKVIFIKAVKNHNSTQMVPKTTIIIGDADKKVLSIFT